MKKNKHKKTVLIIVIISIVIVVIILFSLFLSKKQNEYPSDPISQESLGRSEIASFDLGAIEDHPVGDYKIWEVSSKVFIDDISHMVEKIDPNIELKEDAGGGYYNWADDKGSYFQYSLLNNTLYFNLERGIPWTETGLTGDSFSLFMKTYFDTEWQYKINRVRRIESETSTFYFANRLISDQLPIETSELFNETDYLELENGSIRSGKLLLLELSDTGVKVPLLGLKELSRYINAEAYPKSLFFNQTEIAETLSIKNGYINGQAFNFQKEVKDCRAIKDEVVYLYSTFNQNMLTPVFKLTLDCSLDYEGKEYFLPATAYVNAIQPEYVTVQ